LSLGDIVSFSDKTLLYFYPKDDTPGCTVENKDFSCFKDKFTER
jgi:peroxiredoxin